MEGMIDMEKKSSQINIPDEKLRLEVKKKADDIRLPYYIKGRTDIFDIIEDTALLIRLPLKTFDYSAFTALFNETFVVVLNSSFTLGHERFSAAHELYHIKYNDDILKKEGIIVESDYKKEDKADIHDIANIFAAEFLMPEDLVREQFYKLVNVGPDEVEAKHVVRLFDYFKVSYAAMLKRLVQLNLCTMKRALDIKPYGSKEYIPVLHNIIKAENADINLVEKTKKRYVSKEYLEMIKLNYEKRRISYSKFEELLEYIGMTPEQLNYFPYDEEE